MSTAKKFYTEKTKIKQEIPTLAELFNLSCFIAFLQETLFSGVEICIKFK